MSEWIAHVKRFQAQHGCSYKDALKGASASYRSMKGSGPAWAQPRSDTGQMYTKGGNLKKTSKAQAKRIIEALGDKAIGKLTGMGAVGDMLKQSAANNTVRLMDSGTNRATGEMEGGNVKKTSKAQAKRIIEALGDKAIGRLTGMGAVGDMLKQSAANNTVRLMDSGTNRATGEMETRGTGMRKMLPGFYGIDLLAATRGRGVNRLKKAERWEGFSNAALRDAIDTAGKASRVYYDSTNPLAQLGFGLKKHRKLKGKALLAAGYS